MDINEIRSRCEREIKAAKNELDHYIKLLTTHPHIALANAEDAIKHSARLRANAWIMDWLDEENKSLEWIINRIKKIIIQESKYDLSQYNTTQRLSHHTFIQCLSEILKDIS